jgi:hypothetical protein
LPQWDGANSKKLKNGVPIPSGREYQIGALWNDVYEAVLTGKLSPSQIQALDLSTDFIKKTGIDYRGSKPAQLLEQASSGEHVKRWFNAYFAQYQGKTLQEKIGSYQAVRGTTNIPKPLQDLIDGKTQWIDDADLGMAKGGLVPKFAMGGLIKGPGTGISDSIKAGFGYAGGGSIRVSNGEYVVKAKSVRDYGVDAMNAVNNGTATIGTNSSGTVYNINMPVTSNNANAEGVANEVMRKLKLEVSKNNKSNKVGL